ncbi:MULTISPECIES: DNA polymerase I [unclassified Microcoleus]|uniref:DNA polymerase I n=1 Tax=unclassified Microcoleus TaxID=2642155 RepID=UPI001D91007A|nr:MULTISPECIES: DNA polymerase I [unclassified Microcoleus]MCC3565220.1 DNA polymerase I [Microcoleus sp. PH2017_31_RDM_U_A]MCC3577423.1 DNA polymerase I [Microcoleus sp. PH2017_32_RDM_D_A]MCC3615542.1 DNA polymerase I [Microcoleus sp. PH2017_38_RDM_U_B]
MSENQPPTFILVDGHSLAFRSYFAFAKSRDGGLRTTTGIPTSVCFGFLKSLLEVMAAHDPQYMAIAFDLATPTFRHEADETYKAGRAETPEDFIPDLKNLQELLGYLNLPAVTAPGYEADDVLGTLANKASAAGYAVKILTGDRDLFQLVETEKHISVLYLSTDELRRSGKGKSQEYGPEAVKEKLGIIPAQVIDYKALCGDKSDNIPGVKGIGDKTALQLLEAYNTLDGIYAAIDEIKGATKKKLEEGKEAAYHSQKMATIIQDVPLEINLEDCQLKGFDEAALIQMLEKLEFKTFLSKVKQIQKRFGGEEGSAADFVADVADVADVEKKRESTGEVAISEEQSNANNSTNALRATSNAAEEDALWFWKKEDIPKSPIKPRIIQTIEQLNELIQLLQTFTDKNSPVAWDTETTAIEPRDAELVGIGCCWGTGEQDLAYIPTGHKTGTNLDKATVLNALRPILESESYPKALQNAKFDRSILRCQGIKLIGVVFDTMLASYVLNPETSHSLSELSRKYLNIVAKSYNELVPKGKTIADISIPKVAGYCGMDVHTTFQLVGKLRAELDKADKNAPSENSLHRLLLEVEQPLEPVLAEMEYCGIRIDSAYLNTLSQELEIKLAKLEENTYEAAGRKFNLGSPKQLSEILLEKIPEQFQKKSRKTKTGYSTDAAVLDKLQGDHPIVDDLLEHRTLSKLKSTYVDALPQLVRADTGRVHTDFNQAATGTGRLSSSNPNLQNIPIRTEFSRQIRKAFLPESGWLMVSADYSQIELRILAHLSQEPVLIEAYNNNRDVHTLTAQLLFEKEDVTPDERRFGKTINFGVIYGMGAIKFGRSMGKSSADGKKFIERFNQRYSKVFEFLEKVKKEAIALGYVTTILGRRRYLNFDKNGSLQRLKGSNPEDIHSEQLARLSRDDAQSLRAAANAPIQGSSADIIKLAMIEVDKILQNYQARLLLQVHDELIFEVPPDEWEELQPKIRTAMESALPLSVPLIVDIHAGQNWMETK